MDLGSRLSVGAATLVGQVRAVNEDSVLTLRRIFAIADGMGGHAAGERASALAVRGLARLDGPATVTSEALVDAVTRAGVAIYEEGIREPSRRGMGSTLTGLVIIEVDDTHHWLAFNVGDSRVYECREGRLVQISVDHTEVQELVDNGQLTPDEARVHPGRNVLTRALGSERPPDVDHWILPMVPGQTFLLCSDGLTGELDQSDIEAMLAAAPSAAVAAERLATAALRAGGRDNISVIVVQTLPDDEIAAAADDTLPRIVMHPGGTA